MTWTIVTAALITIFVLGAGGLMTDVGVWYAQLRKPSWNPPNWLFGPAWTLILGLAAWAGVLGWTGTESASERWIIALLFAVNIVFHMLWSPLFFTFKRPDWALIEVPFLWLSVLALVIDMARINTFAAWLLAPYLLWVAFAAYLNLVIVRLNPRGATTS